MDLQELRVQIDSVDRQIIDLVQQRMDIAANIAEYKRQKGLPVLDAAREQVKLETVAAQSREGMGEYMKTVFQTLMAVSREHQQSLLENDNG